MGGPGRHKEAENKDLFSWEGSLRVCHDCRRPGDAADRALQNNTAATVTSEALRITEGQAAELGLLHLEKAEGRGDPDHYLQNSGARSGGRNGCCGAWE